MIFSRLPLWLSTILEAPVAEEGGALDFTFDVKLSEIRGCVISKLASSLAELTSRYSQGPQGSLQRRLGAQQAVRTDTVGQRGDRQARSSASQPLARRFGFRLDGPCIRSHHVSRPRQWKPFYLQHALAAFRRGMGWCRARLDAPLAGKGIRWSFNADDRTYGMGF